MPRRDGEVFLFGTAMTCHLDTPAAPAPARFLVGWMRGL
jgi:hypothetical protein